MKDELNNVIDKLSEFNSDDIVKVNVVDIIDNMYLDDILAESNFASGKSTLDYFLSKVDSLRDDILDLIRNGSNDIDTIEQYVDNALGYSESCGRIENHLDDLMFLDRFDDECYPVTYENLVYQIRYAIKNGLSNMDELPLLDRNHPNG